MLTVRRKRGNFLFSWQRRRPRPARISPSSLAVAKTFSLLDRENFHDKSNRYFNFSRGGLRILATARHPCCLMSPFLLISTIRSTIPSSILYRFYEDEHRGYLSFIGRLFLKCVERYVDLYNILEEDALLL